MARAVGGEGSEGASLFLSPIFGSKTSANTESHTLLTGLFGVNGVSTAGA